MEERRQLPQRMQQRDHLDAEAHVRLARRVVRLVAVEHVERDAEADRRLAAVVGERLAERAFDARVIGCDGAAGRQDVVERDRARARKFRRLLRIEQTHRALDLLLARAEHLLAVEIRVLRGEAIDESFGARARCEIAGRRDELRELRQQILVWADLRDRGRRERRARASQGGSTVSSAAEDT